MYVAVAGNTPGISSEAPKQELMVPLSLPAIQAGQYLSIVISCPIQGYSALYPVWIWNVKGSVPFLKSVHRNMYGTQAVPSTKWNGCGSMSFLLYSRVCWESPASLTCSPRLNSQPPAVENLHAVRERSPNSTKQYLWAQDLETVPVPRAWHRALGAHWGAHVLAVIACTGAAATGTSIFSLSAIHLTPVPVL